jgi:hypothetical protein
VTSRDNIASLLSLYKIKAFKKLLSNNKYHIFWLAKGLSLKKSLYGMNINYLLSFQSVLFLYSCLLCNLVGDPGNLRKSRARKSSSISSTSKEKEKALEEKVEQAEEELKILRERFFMILRRGILRLKRKLKPYFQAH